jgi:hypothetical protein
MEPVTIAALIKAGEMAINRIWPDPNKQAEEQRKLLELSQQGDMQKLSAHVELMLKQAEINLADAKSGNWWQSGWRPAIGWVGALSLALMYIPKALILTYVWTVQQLTMLKAWDEVSPLTIAAFPDLGATDIIGLMVSLLGVAAMRSYDKKNGIDTKR